MLVKTVIDEHFQDYCKPAQFIAAAACDWKCCREANIDAGACQNARVASLPTLEVSIPDLYASYAKNPIAQAVVIGGLEPLLQSNDILALVAYYRARECLDDIVIYTGYTKEEAAPVVAELAKYPNIVVKYGRYVPGHEPHTDPILGVPLASPNQFAERIS